MVWAALQIHTKDECPNVKYTSRNQPLLFDKDETSIWSIDVAQTENEAPDLPQMLKAFKNPDQNMPPIALRYRFTTFHQSFSYEDFIEGIKPQMGDGIGDRQANQVTYEIKDGIFKEICREAENNPTKKYALFIDEINRGNVASIFGELITLIEDDKRLGRDNELTAVLPYSRREFGVPDNLYIIGTMNTADRSVEALDTALRRRFVFEEMRPDCNLVPKYSDGKIDLQKMFIVINARIEQLLDRDHCIGHAYFMGVKNLDDLRAIFANKILPLLREYFYGSPAKIGMVLGNRLVIRQAKKHQFAQGSWGADELDEKDVFAFADFSKLSEQDFATIYAEIPTGV
jgi:5-methylcytosine-specific restriction endonuclease McrBC GTP-binding regulatory subunit McrB